MAFGGQVHENVDPLFGQKRAHRFLVADISLDEAEVRRVFHRLERCEISRIGQLVDHDDAIGRIAGQPARHRRSDEAGTAGDEIIHASPRRSDGKTGIAIR